MWKNQKVIEQTAPGQGSEKKRKGKVAIKRRSRVPGVMITQYVEVLPEGKTTPDFTRKPIALTIQEGRLAFFKAVVTGDPAPIVTWTRNKGDSSDPERYQPSYDEKAGEYILQIPNVSADQADTYKCFATNEFGKAVCTATLNVIEVGFKKKQATQATKRDPADFRKMLKTRAPRTKPEPKKEGEIDPKFWEVLMSSPKKDYERICAEYGVTDYRWMLTKLTQMKKEREEEQAKFVETLSNLKHIEVKTDGSAEFEFDMELKNPNSQVFLYKDGEMIPFSTETEEKHNLKKIGKKYVFSIKDLMPEDAGLYQVDVEDVNVFSTDFKIVPVEFIVKIQEVKAMEREDAVFECVLSHPFSKIIWMGKNTPLEQGEKYDITVSEDKLIHRLVVKDCMQVDKGIYAAIAGIRSCSAWLVVEADNDPSMHGKKKARKTTRAGGGGEDLEKIAREQQAKLQKERDEMEAAKRAQAERDDADAAKTGRGDGADGGAGDGSGAGRDGRGLGDGTAGRGSGLGDGSGLDGSGLGLDGSGVGGLGRDGSGVDGLGRDGSGIGGLGKDGSGVGGLGKDGSGVDGLGIDGIGGKAGLDGTGGDGLGGSASGADGLPGSGSRGDGSLGDEAGGETDGKKKRRTRTGPLVPDKVRDPGVHFTSGLDDINAILGESVEMVCKLSSEKCDGVWYKDGKKLSSKDGLTIEKDGAYHKLKISHCQESDSGKYRFEADGRKTEAMLSVQDPPRFDHDALSEFSKPVIVKAGEKAAFKMPFEGRDPMKVQWYKEGEELLDGTNVKLEMTSNQSRLLLSKCQRKDTGEIKIKIKNEFGTIEATSKLIVLDKPTPPQHPVEVIESSANCIEFKWRPPKDNGGSPITNYHLERQQVGRNTWKKIGDIPGNPPTYRDTDVDHGRKYCYRIRAITAEGVSEVMETDDIMAGTKAYPSAPAAPKVVSAFKDCITLSWVAPTNTGGTGIVGYNLEKRKKGSNLWSPVNPVDEPIKEKKYSVKDVIEGMEYEFRVSAINFSGAGEPSVPSEIVIARDPKKPPGKVISLKVTDSTYSTLSLAWTKPKEEKGVQDEVKGYFVEIRPVENLEWHRCNTNALAMTSYTIKGLKSMAMYWVRVIATNEGGEGEPQSLDNYIIAMPPSVRPKFTDSKMKTFMVVKAGNSVRVNISFEASPMPEITWLKDGMPVSKRVTITNAEGGSQLLIPSSERSDTGVYTIIVKNVVGQETFSIEIRVTDDPKPPGPVEVEQNVAGTLTLSWTPSPDEKRDDRLHYMVSKRDSVKRSWHTVADRLFNNKFTACNILPGREYNFRVYAKNDMGISEPSESTTWGTKKNREKFTVSVPESKAFNFEMAPSFLVPLKMHTAPKGYECYMSCAVRGDPAPRVTWYRNNISLNTNTNYYIKNVCGVCSMLILRVGPKDTGEYKVIAENPLGRAECSTNLTVRE